MADNFIAPVRNLFYGESMETLLGLIKGNWDFLMAVIGFPPQEVATPIGYRVMDRPKKKICQNQRIFDVF
jgi:hypothetical protein